MKVNKTILASFADFCQNEDEYVDDRKLSLHFLSRVSKKMLKMVVVVDWVHIFASRISLKFAFICQSLFYFRWKITLITSFVRIGPDFWLKIPHIPTLYYHIESNTSPTAAVSCSNFSFCRKSWTPWNPWNSSTYHSYLHIELSYLRKIRVIKNIFWKKDF